MSYIYIVRIELYKPDDNYYEELHETMEEIGFSRTITSEKGKEYHLPDAEYYIKVNLEREDVLTHVVNAVSSITINFRALVTGRGGVSWHNLKPIKK